MNATDITATVSTRNSSGAWEAIEILNEVADPDDMSAVDGLTTYLREQRCPAGDYSLTLVENDGPAQVAAEGSWDGETLALVDDATVRTYAAHIVTVEARMGDPEIIVMTQADEAGSTHPLATYPLLGDTVPAVLLAEEGWSVHDDTEDAGTGYTIVTVHPVDVDRIIRHVTYAREQASIEYDRRDTAWRTLIRDAMLDGESATRLAAAAGVSRERVYQVRDGRR